MLSFPRFPLSRRVSSLKSMKITSSPSVSLSSVSNLKNFQALFSAQNASVLPRGFASSSVNQTLFGSKMTKVSSKLLSSKNSFSFTPQRNLSALELPPMGNEEEVPEWVRKFPELPKLLSDAETAYRDRDFLTSSNWYRKAIELIKQNRLEPEPGKLFNFLVSRFLECHGRLGQIGDVKTFCEDLLFNELKDEEHQLASLLWYGLGDVYSQNAFFDAKKAKKCYEQSLEECKQPGIVYKTNFGVYNGLGKLNLMSGNFESSMHYFDLALEATKETPVLPQTLAHLYNNRAMAFVLTGRIDQGLEVVKQAFEHATSPPEDINEKQRSLSLMASISRQKGDLNQALEYLDQVLQISNQLNNNLGRVASMTEIGQIYAFMGKPDQSRYLFEESLKIASQMNDPAVLSQVQRLLDGLPKKE